jgi:uncharacterized protein
MADDALPKFNTGFLHYDAKLKVMVAVAGHPFNREGFAAMFEAMDGIAATFVDQPVAARMMTVAGMKEFDALVLYDLPGIDLLGGIHRQDPKVFTPSEDIRAGIEAMLRAGKGVVALHHALAGWPGWDGYAELLGGRFGNLSSSLRGKPLPASGFKPGAPFNVSVVDATHPVVRGLPASFPLFDEPYLMHPLEDSIVPLLRSDYVFERENFLSAEIATMQGRFANDGWYPGTGSNVIGWVKRALNSPLTYIQPGDAASAYGNPHYRLLVENAIRWVASEEAHRWAAAS